MGVWDCCGKCKPKYKRLIDNIYPATAEEGIDRAHLDKLVFYSLSHPDKLDKIGKYLLFCLEYYLSRRRYEYAKITMEAMDSLLSSCKSSDQHTRLNLFVGSFLKMNLLLLECPDVGLQAYAVSSFVKFADIPEDIPSYHRSYDQFVDKFSMMCHNNDADPATRKAIRRAGMMGIRGIIRKTGSDDLQVNIWEQVHMDKIVPSLIFNMQQTEDLNRGISKESNGVDGIAPSDVQELETFATSILQEICGRTMFANIKAVMSPALKHLDNNGLWVPGEFAIHVIKTICYAIPNQYAYKAVQVIVGHLDNHVQSPPEMKTTIAKCLAQTVDIATSVGPSVFEVFSALLRHLKISVDRQIRSSEHGEQLYQEALVVTIGEFATNLPDYQKIEIMRFIMDKVVLRGGEDNVSATWLPLLLLRSLLKVATKYVPVHLTTTFPIAFLDLLMRVSLSASVEVRILVHSIFHTLLDRHGNLARLADNGSSVPGKLALTIQDPPSTEDASFAKNNMRKLILCMYENLDRGDNSPNLVRAVNATVTLLMLELGRVNEEVLVEFIRFLLAVQELALVSTDMTTMQRNATHGLAACCFSLVPMFVEVPLFSSHINEVITEREKSFPETVPPGCFTGLRSLSTVVKPAHAPMLTARSTSKSSMTATPTGPPLFNLAPLLEDIEKGRLRLDPEQLQNKYVAEQLDKPDLDRQSVTSRSRSTIYGEDDQQSESDHWTRTVAEEAHFNREEDISVEAFRRILHETNDSGRAATLEKARRMNEISKNSTFKELIAIQEKMDSRLSQTVFKILRTPNVSSPDSSSVSSFDMGDDSSHDASPTEKFEMKVRRGFRKLSTPGQGEPSTAAAVPA